MSIKIMSRVWDDSATEGGALLLMLAIADHCHDDGTGAWPAISTLAHKTRQSERHVQRLLLQLESSGELQIVKGGGRANTNEYRIQLKGDILSNSANQKRVTSEPERVTSCPIKGDIAMSPDPSLTVIDPKTPEGGGEKPKAFRTPIMLRLDKLFDRRASTRWDKKELAALKLIEPVEEDDLTIIESYYRQNIPKLSDIRRRSLVVLLNNWNGEVDRARQFKPNTGY